MTTVALSHSFADTIREQFPFSVDKLPLRGPEGLATPHYGLFRSDTMECVGNAVRRGYEPHTNLDVTCLVDAAAAGFDDDVQPRITCLWRGGHYVSIAPSNRYRATIFGTDDNIFPRFLVSAGYGSSAFTASLGLYRDVCSNLQMITLAGESISAKIRHTKSLPNRVDELVKTFRALANKWHKVVDTANEMQSRSLVLRDYVEEIFPQPRNASDRTRRSYSRRFAAIQSRILRERMATGNNSHALNTVTAWEAFQGVQGYVQHDQRRNGRPTRFERAAIALEDTNVTKALQLALAS